MSTEQKNVGGDGFKEFYSDALNNSCQLKVSEDFCSIGPTYDGEHDNDIFGKSKTAPKNMHTATTLQS